MKCHRTRPTPAKKEGDPEGRAPGRPQRIPARRERQGRQAAYLNPSQVRPGSPWRPICRGGQRDCLRGQGSRVISRPGRVRQRKRITPPLDDLSVLRQDLIGSPILDLLDTVNVLLHGVPGICPVRGLPSCRSHRGRTNRRFFVSLPSFSPRCPPFGLSWRE